MALVLALGNPGERYERTRHNVGWRVLDELAARWSAAGPERAANSLVWRAAPGGREVRLMKPLTFMNASGEALAAWREEHGLEIPELLVVGDDIYLPVGALRIRARGSSGGHRGLESVEETLGTRDYARLRIGVGAAGSEGLREHVLDRFTADEEKEIETSVHDAADAVECWLQDGLLAAMNRFNRRAGREVPEP